MRTELSPRRTGGTTLDHVSFTPTCGASMTTAFETWRGRSLAANCWWRAVPPVSPSASNAVRPGSLNVQMRFYLTSLHGSLRLCAPALCLWRTFRASPRFPVSVLSDVSRRGFDVSAMVTSMASSTRATSMFLNTADDSCCWRRSTEGRGFQNRGATAAVRIHSRYVEPSSGFRGSGRERPTPAFRITARRVLLLGTWLESRRRRQMAEAAATGRNT